MSRQQPPRLLLLAQDDADDPLEPHLATGGFLVERCLAPETAEELLGSDPRLDLMVVTRELSEDQLRGLCAAAAAVNPPVPLLLLSSREPVRALEAGADAVLPPPHGHAEVLARCRALVRRRQLLRPQSTVLRCGPIAMVVEEHEVRRDGRPVKLSPREFRLLRFLLEHQRRIWHREELLRLVWGECEGPALDPKTVDVHIRWLRLKLEDDPARPRLICTVRGRGYRLG
ncbi:response regulator transcription factor [Cyanobium sp. CH-040]|uniref:response regulator transcription factor n=1 Tax=Cyanobium sp. CH-040 TaxID=2823708 RepID=UPI0020CE4EE8|nr:response regulator transcription factor [Cyanobium sp. CH-040]MCP9929058.1 response regulator transcription factor [Cyanobium sp. CH-040]